MKPPIFVRKPSDEERENLQAGLRSRETFVMRRCQILLASARGLWPPKIAESLGCGSQTARNAIHAFNQRHGRAGRRLLAPEARPCRLRPAQRRVLEGDAPPLPEGIRVPDEPVDA